MVLGVTALPPPEATSFTPLTVSVYEVPAVSGGWLREIKSTLILQPGPAALTDGLDQLAGIISEWAEERGALGP